MANTIRIKRRPSSGSAGSPSAASLYNGELAFNENDNILYYAYGSGVGGISTAVPAIAGSGAYSLRGGSNASGTWPISINGNSAYTTNAVYTTGNQTIEGTKIFYTSGGSSAVGIKSDTDYAPALSFMEGSSSPKISFMWDGSVNKFKLLTGSAPATAFTFQVNTHLEVRATGTSSSATNIPVFISNPNSSAQTIYTRTPSELKSDIGLGNVENLALSGITFTAGSGLAGGGTLAANRTFNIGQGDGISVSADAIAVDSTVVRTTGTQSIGGAKTFGDGLTVGNNVGNFLAGTSGVRFTHPQINFQIDAGNLNPGFDGDALRLDIDSENGNGYVTTLKSNAPVQNITVRLPDTSGTLALDKRNMIAGSGLVGGGDLSADRTFNIGQGDGINVSADSISVDSTVVRTTGTQSINGAKSFLDSSNNYNIFSTVNDKFYVKAPNVNDTTYYFVGLDGGGSPPDSNSADRSLVSRSTSQVKTDLSLNNVTNDAQIKKLASTSGGYVPTWNGTTGDALNIGYSVETTLTGGTGALPRADAVKTYVDNMIGSGIATNDAMIFKGTIDCSTNPNYPAADRGWVYKISVAGRIGGASGPVVEVNDTIICGTDGTAAGTHASVGSNWNILQTNIVDASILVTGPTSATSGNFAMFDGTTGKIVKDSSLSSSSFATAGHVHGNITNAGAIGSTANLPIITTTAGALTTGSFGSTANTFCQGNDSRLSDTRNTTNSITVNNGGAGDSSSFTFNGSAARTISYNSIGAPSISGSNATGTWNISVTGNAGTVTSGIYTYGSYADPSWITSLAKSKVGLSNVENTALSTWAGSANLTTLGTVVTGTWNATTIAVDKGGTGQTSYTNGQLLIGNTTGNTLTKATLTQGTAIDITNGGGSITIGHNDTSTLTGAQGSNGIASFTVDGMGHVTAVTTATYLTAGTVCAAIVDCSLDGGTF
jgi:hypothetical protein